MGAADTNGVSDIFVRDRTAGETFRSSLDLDGGEGDAASEAASTTSSGELVGYESSAGNLLPDDTNGLRDVFLTGDDTDGDGSIDQFDAFDTDPTETLDNDSDGIGDSADTDDDNDTTTDVDELANGLNPINPADATMDFDGDGFSNLVEIIAGTDPFDINDFPAVAVPALGRFGHWSLVPSLAALGLIVTLRGRRRA